LPWRRIPQATRGPAHLYLCGRRHSPSVQPSQKDKEPQWKRMGKGRRWAM
jgi:hypothetical protein